MFDFVDICFTRSEEYLKLSPQVFDELRSILAHFCKSLPVMSDSSVPSGLPCMKYRRLSMQ